MIDGVHPQRRREEAAEGGRRRGRVEQLLRRGRARRERRVDEEGPVGRGGAMEVADIGSEGVRQQPLGLAERRRIAAARRTHRIAELREIVAGRIEPLLARALERRDQRERLGPQLPAFAPQREAAMLGSG